ncbi:MAG: transposase [bacterium]
MTAITQHIPEKSFQMIRYYGWYSNKTRGMREKQGILRPGDERKKTEVEVIERLGVSALRESGRLTLWSAPIAVDP